MTNVNFVTSKNDLLKEFSEIGVKKGMSVMLHSSMSSLGYVVNGACDVIDSLLEIIGYEGNLLMPAHSGQLTDPSSWASPSVPKEHIPKIKDNMNPFYTKKTPIRNRGIIPQTFLNYPEVLRSSHPLNSVIVKGLNAKYFTDVHDLHESEGMNSPIGRLYEREGYILLIGVTLTDCTAIHLAEFIADVPYLKETSLKVLVRQRRKNRFVKLRKYPKNSKHFDKLIPEFRKKEIIKQKFYGEGVISFFPIKPAIDLIINHLKKDTKFLIKP